MARDNHWNLILGACLALAVGGAYLSGRGAPGRDPAPPAPARSPAPGEASAPAPAPDPHLQAGAEAIRRRDWESARRELEQVSPDQADYPNALHNLAILYEELGDPLAALGAYRKLVEMDPGDGEARVGLGWAHYLLGDPAEAERATLAGLEHAPDLATGHYNLGLYRLAQGRLEDAVTSYQRGFLADHEDGFRSAFNDLRKYRTDHPDQVEVDFVRALFYAVMGESGLEVKALGAYLAAAPEGPGREVARKRYEAARKDAIERGLLIPGATPSPTPT